MSCDLCSEYPVLPKQLVSPTNYIKYASSPYVFLYVSPTKSFSTLYTVLRLEEIQKRSGVNISGFKTEKYPDQFPACEGGQSYFQCYRKNIFKCSALLLFHKVRKKQDTLKHSMEGSSQQNNNIHEVCTTWVPTSNNCYG